MSQITLTKKYVAERSRAILKRIDDRRTKLVHDLYDEYIRYYYRSDSWFDFYWRWRNGWPNEEPEGTAEDLEDFVTYKLTDEERAKTAYAYSLQYDTCKLLLHMATLPGGPEETMIVDIIDYERIADTDHKP